MPKLSTLQASTLDAFRKANPGPVGVILEDDQGYDALLSHLTGEPIHPENFDADLERRKIAVTVYPTGSLEKINLAELARSYSWCFILFHGTYGRDDIAEQIDQLPDAGLPLDRLVLANYQLDHSEAKDDLRRLFALVPTVELCFADAGHLFEIEEDDVALPPGARNTAKLFAHLRKAVLPVVATSFREFRRSVEELEFRQQPKDVVNVVRDRLAEAMAMLFRFEMPGLPTKKEFDQKFESAVKAFLADIG